MTAVRRCLSWNAPIQDREYKPAIVHSSEGAKNEADQFMKQATKIRKVAFLDDYLPRKCGIATFTSDLLTAWQPSW